MTPALRDAFRPEYAHEYPIAPGLGPLPIEWRDRWVFTEEHVVALLGTLRLGGAALGYAVRMACGLDVRRGNDDAAAALAAARDACPALAAEVARAESEGRQRLRVEGVGGPPERDAAVPLGGGGLPPVGMLRSGAGETEQEGGEGGHAPQVAAAATTTQGRDAGSVVGAAVSSARPADRDAWAEAMRVSAAGEAERAAETRSKRASEATDDGGVGDRWARAHEEAAVLGGAQPDIGRLLWVERRCVDAGLHAMHPLWIRHFADFYASGAFEDVGRFGVRAAKSDSTCRAITAEVLLMPRILERTVNARCPVMSANINEANDRFVTITEILRACGILDFFGHGDVNEGTFKKSGGGMAPLIIELHDAQGHKVKFQVSAANEAAAAGFTGIAGFCDELDLYGKATGANPAAKVLRILRSRYATQPDARLHLMSATYDRESEHARLVGLGPSVGRYIARIGEEGARADHEARLRLAALIHSADPLLLAPPLSADCPDIPSWVTNPIAPIEAAYAKSADLREMFGLYGGRLELAGAAAMTLEDAEYMAAQNEAMSRPMAEAHRGGMRADGLLHVHGYNNDSGAPLGASPRRYRGL